MVPHASDGSIEVDLHSSRYLFLHNHLPINCKSMEQRNRNRPVFIFVQRKMKSSILIFISLRVKLLLSCSTCSIVVKNIVISRKNERNRVEQGMEQGMEQGQKVYYLFWYSYKEI